MEYRTVIVKVGTTTLTRGTDRLDDAVMAGIAGQISRVRECGSRVILVTSGAVAAGRARLALPPDRRDVPAKQVLASVGQSVLMHRYEELFRPYGIMVAQTLLTRRDMADRQAYLNTRNTLLSLLDLDVLPVVNENDVTAVDEIRLGDNDNLSAMVANLVDADLLVLLTDIGGLYTADPRLDPSATLIRDVSAIDHAIERAAGLTRSTQGTGGMRTKLQAARGAMRWGTTVVICRGDLPDVISRVIAGEPIGTTFHAASTGMESRKRWLASGLACKGELIIDDGATVAIIERGKSLLPAGIRRVEGRFKRGEAVQLCAADGRAIACGLANYDAADVAAVAGQRSDEIVTILGYTYGPDVVHRNNLVLLDRVSASVSSVPRGRGKEEDR